MLSGRQDSNYISTASSMENKSSSAILLLPFLRLPPEIRLKIYRLLLLSEASISMQIPHNQHETYPLNRLFPAILSTCHLIYDEALDVLYKENVFRAHRINNSNKNAVLITQAKFVIGTNGHGEADALRLALFLDTHPNLKLLKLDFLRDCLRYSAAPKAVGKALLRSGYSSALSVFSNCETRTSSHNKALIEQVVAQNALRK